MSRPSAHHRRKLASIAKKRCRLIRRLAITLHEERLRRDPPPPRKPPPPGFAGLDFLIPVTTQPWPYGRGGGGEPMSTGSFGGISRMQISERVAVTITRDI